SLDDVPRFLRSAVESVASNQSLHRLFRSHVFCPFAFDLMKLAGRQALITGGSRGFGRHLAKAFWREGASLLLVARTAKDLTAVKDSLQATAVSGQFIHIL